MEKERERTENWQKAIIYSDMCLYQVYKFIYIKSSLSFTCSVKRWLVILGDWLYLLLIEKAFDELVEKRIYRNRKGAQTEVFEQTPTNLEIQVLNCQLVYLNTNWGHAITECNSSFKKLSIQMLNIYSHFLCILYTSILLQQNNLSRKIKIKLFLIFD